jgi:hypothetical protein
MAGKSFRHFSIIPQTKTLCEKSALPIGERVRYLNIQSNALAAVKRKPSPIDSET